jgi:FlaA1/EpsC-like NDP-sugar epimerase
LRQALAPDRDIAITEIGAKPGEKMYEELMNEEEVRRTFEYGDFFVTLSAFADATAPAYAHLVDCPQPDKPYKSTFEPSLAQAALAKFFDDHEIT